MKLVFILLFILLIPALNALTEIKRDMSLGSAATVNGKTVTILDVSSYGDLKVEVDGVKGIVHQNKAEMINDMQLRILNLTMVDDYMDLELEISVQYECGDGFCNDTETSKSCCTDCDCNEGRCISNICQFDLCVIHSDCDDNNLCTIDNCTGLPKACQHTEITSCITDGCCPANCNYLKDEDCEFQGECFSDEVCNDNNPCTNDRCTNNTCENVKIEGCALNGKCVPVGEVLNITYCSTNGWENQKEVNVECANSYECLTGLCKSDKCYKEWNKSLILWLLITAILVFGVSYKLHKLYKKDRNIV